ncbi:MAG TPA: flagellar biosynthesis protein FliQ [Candidatus Aminicenantes bacterium]|nr:flagellar biosynthesis protein FliQ [Candidatus Aminicenantes bacterium]
MSEALIVSIAREAIWTAIQVAAPVMLVSLIVGLFISVFQAATSISDSTLNFAPKVLAAVIVLALTLPWMIHKLSALIHFLMVNLPRFVRG